MVSTVMRQNRLLTSYPENLFVSLNLNGHAYYFFGVLREKTIGMKMWKTNLRQLASSPCFRLVLLWNILCGFSWKGKSGETARWFLGHKSDVALSFHRAVCRFSSTRLLMLRSTMIQTQNGWLHLWFVSCKEMYVKRCWMLKGLCSISVVPVLESRRPP
jgi:hypothetical protein